MTRETTPDYKRWVVRYLEQNHREKHFSLLVKDNLKSPPLALTTQKTAGRKASSALMTSHGCHMRFGEGTMVYYFDHFRCIRTHDFKCEAKEHRQLHCSSRRLARAQLNTYYGFCQLQDSASCELLCINRRKCLWFFRVWSSHGSKRPARPIVTNIFNRHNTVVVSKLTPILAESLVGSTHKIRGIELKRFVGGIVLESFHPSPFSDVAALVPPAPADGEEKPSFF